MSYLVLFGFIGASMAWAQTDAQPIEFVQKFNYTKEIGEFDLFVGVQYSPTEPNIFFTGLRSGEVARWNDQQSEPEWTRPVASEMGTIDGIALSKDGALLGVVGGGAYIKLLNTADGSVIETSYHTGEFNPLPLLPHFTAIAFDHSGEFFATGDANGHIYIWQAGTDKPLSVFRGADFPIKQLSFSKNGEFLVSANNVEVLIWNWVQQELVVNLGDQFEVGPFWAESVYLPPYEGILIITTYHDVVLYEVSSQSVLKRYPAPIDSEGDRAQDLMTVANPELTHLWRFYKEPIIDKLDLDTGNSIQAYMDPTFLEGGFLSISVYVKVARKPGNPNEFAAGVMTWQVDIFRNDFKLLTQLRFYRL